ncbi:hypothetical protein [Saccharopolyspora cebuensis]|uniref:Uncharacterized protein n=1 Tax=Saccharopolyspora cebuensis TaxID=418759 RepID=A0ABV4CMD1_9PSEU
MWAIRAAAGVAAFLAASAATSAPAHAGASDEGSSALRGLALIQFSNNGDSLIEFDRVLNFDSGEGSAGADHDGG